MQFGRVNLDNAIGAILAHTVALASGALKKGRKLSVPDIEALRRSGHDAVTVAILDATDVGEDDAAARISARVAGANTRIAAPFTGRANIYATSAGLVTLDAAAITALNAVDERITIATVQPFERVADGQMLATVKIIPFAVPEDVVAKAAEIAVSAAITVSPFHAKRVGLVITQLPSMKDSVAAKRQHVTEARVAACGGTTETVMVAHEPQAVGTAVGRLARAGCDAVLIFSATAIVDRGDVVPSGLVTSGGRIERLGMPVDPGNLLLLGSVDSVPVVGIPTCAASPKANGFDWVLERILADIPISGRDIAAMGVGGLLKEIASRPQPRDSATGGVSVMGARRAARIAAVVLAGGRASRMGENKLAAEVGGVAIVRRTVAEIQAAGIEPILVVTGHDAERVRSALVGLHVAYVHNPDYAEGLSTSLRTGIGALDATVDGAFVVLGDMPEVPSGLYRRMMAAFSPPDRRGIVVPVVGGKRGNPVLWAHAYFAEMAKAQGDTGAKHLIGENADDVAEVPAEDEAVFTDIDTPEALKALRERLGRD